MLLQVTEFMDHDVINNSIGCHEDLPIEINPALGRTGTPSGFETQLRNLYITNFQITGTILWTTNTSRS